MALYALSLLSSLTRLQRPCSPFLLRIAELSSTLFGLKSILNHSRTYGAI